MKVVGFIPAKGSSDRVSNKNTRELFGKPLFRVNLEKLIECSLIDEAYLDTESEEIIKMAEGIGCEILRRDPALATNKTDGNQLLLNEASKVDADIYVMILGTSPFIKINTIENGIKVLLENEEYDSVVAVRREKFYLWNNGKPVYDINNIPNSFTLEDTIIETMGLYIIRKNALLSTRRRIGNRPYLLNVSPVEAIDVNYPEDYELAKFIAKGMMDYEF
jgi:CMP-N-acetylneuraminic acid synthetase